MYIFRKRSIYNQNARINSITENHFKVFLFKDRKEYCDGVLLPQLRKDFKIVLRFCSRIMVKQHLLNIILKTFLSQLSAFIEGIFYHFNPNDHFDHLRWSAWHFRCNWKKNHKDQNLFLVTLSRLLISCYGNFWTIWNILIHPFSMILEFWIWKLSKPESKISQK